MKIAFPSTEFDDAVAAVCQGFGSDDQVRGLNELLRSDPDARDEYLLRVELHSRLAAGANRLIPAMPEKPADSNVRKKAPPDC